MMKQLPSGLYKINFIVVASSCILQLVRSQILLQTITDTIGAENYTYYRISRQGHLTLQLESLTGDADLYISDKILRPTFDNYELQSITCGIDTLEISQVYNRPIGVAVYGHPSQSETVYRLSVFFVSDEEQQDYNYYDTFFNAYPGEDSGKFEKPPRYKPSQIPVQEEESESVLWTIVMTILKVIFEILL